MKISEKTSLIHAAILVGIAILFYHFFVGSRDNG